MNNNIFADNNFRKILEEQIKNLGKNRMPIPNTNEDFPEDNICIDNIERMVKEMGKGVFNPDPFMFQKLQKLRNQQEVQISGESYPKVNVSKNDSSFIIRAYIPGIRKSDIDIAINDNKLTISSSAEIKSKASMTDEFCLIKEFDDSSNILDKSSDSDFSSYLPFPKLLKDDKLSRVADTAYDDKEASESFNIKHEKEKCKRKVMNHLAELRQKEKAAGMAF